MSNFLNRLHALDNLRAILALLGIPFHATLFLFLTSQNYAAGLHFDLYQLLKAAPVSYSITFLIIFFSHIFRMPAFFLLAGFFAHLLYQKMELKKFFVNRFFRIGLPFLVVMLWLVPSYLNSILIGAAKLHIQQNINFSDAWFQVLVQDYKTGNFFIAA